MNNLVLITSIIKTPEIPLSYAKKRSIYSHDERYEQTKKTIQSIKEKIPNCKIILVECSHFDANEVSYFKNNVDYFINLISNSDDVNSIYSPSKSLGEGIMTMRAIEFIFVNQIKVDNFFKLTGRYWLSKNFLYENFENTLNIIHYINNNKNNVATSLYKLNYQTLHKFYEFLFNNIYRMKHCIGYEVLFALFLKQIEPNMILHKDKIGVNGFISVSRDFVDN
jgi:hypothetical protein